MPLPRGCAWRSRLWGCWMLVFNFSAGKPLPSPEVFYVWHWWCPTPMKQESEGISVKGCVEVLAHASNRICFWIRFISTPKPFQSGSVQTQALDPDIPGLSCHSKTSIGRGSERKQNKEIFFLYLSADETEFLEEPQRTNRPRRIQSCFDKSCPLYLK